MTLAMAGFCAALAIESLRDGRLGSATFLGVAAILNGLVS